MFWPAFRELVRAVCVQDQRTSTARSLWSPKTQRAYPLIPIVHQNLYLTVAAELEARMGMRKRRLRSETPSETLRTRYCSLGQGGLGYVDTYVAVH